MDALDRELAAAFAVDPSPEFVARVREAVAREPEPRSWRMPRLLLAGAALSAVVAVAVSVGRVDDRVPAVSHTASPAALLAPVAASGSSASVAASAVVASGVASGFSRTDAVGRQRTRRRSEAPSPIQLVSIEDLPTAPMGAVVPQMAVEVVTLTGVHP